MPLAPADTAVTVTDNKRIGKKRLWLLTTDYRLSITRARYDEVAPISQLSFRDGPKGRARNPYSQLVVMDSGLAPLARPGMTRMVQY